MGLIPHGALIIVHPRAPVDNSPMAMTFLRNFDHTFTRVMPLNERATLAGQLLRGQGHRDPAKERLRNWRAAGT